MRLVIFGLGVFIGTVVILKLIWKSEPDYATAGLKFTRLPDSHTYTEFDGTQWSWTAP